MNKKYTYTLNTLTIVLIVTLLLIQARNTCVFLAFKYQQKAIAENSCVNRFNKQSTCKGKCQLYAKLSPSTKNIHPFRSALLLKYDFLTLLSNLAGTPTKWEIPSYSSSVAVILKRYQDLYFFLTNFDLEQPPD